MIRVWRENFLKKDTHTSGNIKASRGCPSPRLSVRITAIMDHKEKLGIFWDSIPPFWVHLTQDNLAFPQQLPSCHCQKNNGLHNLVWLHAFLLSLSKLKLRDQITWKAHNWLPQNPCLRSPEAPSPSQPLRYSRPFRATLGRFSGIRRKRPWVSFSLYCNRWPFVSAHCVPGIILNRSWLLSHLRNRTALTSTSSPPHDRSGKCGSAKWNNLFRVTKLGSSRQGVETCSL